MTIGLKYDGDKTRYDLVPSRPYEAWADVLTFGAKKYGDHNWKNVQSPRERYYAAAIRHLESWRRGDLIDNESGLPHLAHAMSCLGFLMEFDNDICNVCTVDGFSGVSIPLGISIESNP